jgi:hypothetical protein
VTLTGDELRTRVGEHLAAVKEIYDRVVLARRVEPVMPAAQIEGRKPEGGKPERRRPGVQARFERFDRFLEQLPPEAAKRLDESPKLAAAVRDLFDHSTYFADQLLRYPVPR